MMTIVYAGNHSQFLNWCVENKRSPRDRDLHYVSDPDRIRGLQNVRVVRYGTWFERKDLNYFQNLVNAMQASGAFVEPLPKSEDG